MSVNVDGLKVKKDAAVSALFSLYKAAGDASSAVLDLINYLESSGFDAKELRAAFAGTNPADLAKINAGPEQVVQAVAATGVPKRDEPAKQANAEPEAPAPETDDAESPKKKPKRAPRDPNAPKRPLNAFLKFRNQESKKISEERKSKGEPDLSRTDMSVAVKEHWDNLPESVRENLVQESKNELERYHVDLASYKESTANGGLSQLESSQAEPGSSQLPQSQAILTQEEAESTDSQPKKKQKKKDDTKKDEKEKKKRKKHATD